MFQLSLLSINQLDTAGYTSTFGCGKCPITSPSITVTGNWVNDPYTMSPATALTSTVPSMSTKSTSRRRKKKRKNTSIFGHSTEPTTNPLHTASPSAASTVPQWPSAAESPKPTQKPLTMSESLLSHHHLAHIHPTALQSLIDGYTNDNSMYTTCIEAKHKQKIIKVQTKRTTKPFQYIRSDVCGPSSTPISAGHRYYILFIADYARYTFVWARPDMNSKTYPSAYQSF